MKAEAASIAARQLKTNTDRKSSNYFSMPARQVVRFLVKNNCSDATGSATEHLKMFEKIGGT